MSTAINTDMSAHTTLPPETPAEAKSGGGVVLETALGHAEQLRMILASTKYPLAEDALSIEDALRWDIALKRGRCPNVLLTDDDEQPLPEPAITSEEIVRVQQVARLLTLRLEAETALACLYISVDERIAKDVNDKVRAFIRALETEKQPSKQITGPLGESFDLHSQPTTQNPK